MEDLEEEKIDENQLIRFNSRVKERSRRRLDWIEKLEERVDALEEELAKRPTEDEVHDRIQSSRELPRQWDVWLAEDVADVRDRTFSDRLLGR
jgi:SMC interacting uncharacterized protein involved in chromosome segregation